jgi:hypothetical protein
MMSNRNSNRICDRVLLDESVADSPRISVSIFRAVVITSSRDVSDPRTDPGVRVRGPRVGSLTSRLLSRAPRSRGERRRADSTGDRYGEYSQSKDTEGEGDGPHLVDRGPQTTVIEANRPKCLRGDGRPGSITPSTSPSLLCHLCHQKHLEVASGERRSARGSHCVRHRSANRRMAFLVSHDASVHPFANRDDSGVDALGLHEFSLDRLLNWA